MNSQALVSEFQEFLEVRNFAVTTVSLYTREALQFLEFLLRIGLSSVTAITKAHLEQYRLEIFYLRGKPKSKNKGQPLAMSTQSLRLVAVCKFITFLVHAEYLLVDVAAGFQFPKKPDVLPRAVLSERETLTLLLTPDVSHLLGVRDRAILEVLYGTGIRNAELRSLTLGQLDQGRQLLRVLGKGSKERVVPFGEEAEIWLEEYLNKVRPLLLRDPHNPWIFLTTNGRRFCCFDLITIVARLAKKAGLTKTVTPHVLRHSCATHMLSRGADLRYLQALLGHSNIGTTEVYTRVDVADLRRVILRCHPRERKA
jgi:integrase/recombinase XerD